MYLTQALHRAVQQHPERTASIFGSLFWNGLADAAGDGCLGKVGHRFYCLGCGTARFLRAVL